MMRRLFPVGVFVAVAMGSSSHVQAQQASESRPVIVDRVIARWRTVSEDSRGSGHVIFARELAFEARVEGMSVGDSSSDKIADRHLRAALARHVTESLLEELPLDPPATPTEIAERAVRARKALEARVGSAAKLEQARVRERISVDELDSMLRRTARASLYLDRMVAPLLEPSDVELRELHAAGKTPFTNERFSEVVEKARRWVVAQRLSSALDDFWQRTRSRIVITWVEPKSTKAAE